MVITTSRLIFRPGFQLQYKYVVRNSDGSVARWMAGDNFEILTSADRADLPAALRVLDTWDASKHAIEVPSLYYCASTATPVHYTRHCAVLWF